MESEPDSNTEPSLTSQGFAKHPGGPIYERVYDVGISHNGTKGQILSNSEAMGQKVFICDSKSSRVIRATIKWDEKCQDCNRSHLGVIELPSDWIGRRVFIRPFEIVRM
jgi:hypothetical protein